MSLDLSALFHKTSDLTVDERIDFLSDYFMGKPYLVNPLGEGDQGEIDQAPLYRFDGFDCVTFVNTVLALALSNDLSSFEKNILKLNYYDGLPRFENRFHFMSADWNPQNQKNKIIFDMTQRIVDDNKMSVAKDAQGDIDRPSWFLKRAEQEKLPHRVAHLKSMAKHVKQEWVSLPYVPLTALFDDALFPKQGLFDQFPKVSIIEIVRPNWNLKEKIGTHLHVSHMGFAIRQKTNELIFRHASSEKKAVVEVLLSEYLKNYLDSITIKGINIQMVLQ